MITPIKKIVFIEPKSPGFHVFSKWGLPRLGTIILGTMLRNQGYDVKIFIEDIKGIDLEAIFEADAVGISTITSTAPRAYELANVIRKEGIPVFMGGAHVTFMDEEALDHCDFVFRGEAEETILPFLEALKTGVGFENIRGLSYRAPGGTIVRNADVEHCPDLDRYPSPDFSLIHGNTDRKVDMSMTPVMMSRGCPFGCNFCSVTRIFGRGYRFRSVESVITELKELKAEHVFFYDDNFTANRAHTKKLLERMIEEGIKTKWTAQVRVDVAKDEELLALMKKSGCFYVYIGLESANQRVLEAMDKGQTVEDMEYAIKKIHNYGINIHGMFIFGTDQDNISTIRSTVKFAKRMKIASVQFMTLLPLPGTPVYANMEKEGRLLTRDWSNYDGHVVVFKPKGMTYWELQKETLRAMLRFYSLRRILGRLVKLDIYTMVIRAYGRKFVRKGKRANKDLTKQLKHMYHQAGDSVCDAGEKLQTRARKTSDELKESLKHINWERIRRAKAARLQGGK